MNYFTSTKTPSTHKPNEAWNNLINNDAAGMFQLYYQNTHGVPWDEVQLNQDFWVLAEFNLGCYCFSETNLDWRCYFVRNDFLQKQWQMWKYAKSSFSLIDMESTADYITGGMVTSVLGSWSSRVLSADQDPTSMGRWSELLLTGKKQTKISLFTGYWCVHSNGDASTWTNETIFMKDW